MHCAQSSHLGKAFLLVMFDRHHVWLSPLPSSSWLSLSLLSFVFVAAGEQPLHFSPCAPVGRDRRVVRHQTPRQRPQAQRPGGHQGTCVPPSVCLSNIFGIAGIAGLAGIAFPVFTFAYPGHLVRSPGSPASFVVLGIVLCCLCPICVALGLLQALSRNHVIEVSDSKLVTITGGKWTTFRRMAEVGRVGDDMCVLDRNRNESANQLLGSRFPRPPLSEMKDNKDSEGGAVGSRACVREHRSPV